MWASFGNLSVIPWILFAQMSWSMDIVPVITAAVLSSKVTVEFRDGAELFGRGAEQRAKEALRRIHRKHRTPINIETIKSLDGAWIADVATRRARMAGTEQLYILVAGDARDVGVISARQGPASRLTDQERERIRQAFLGPLQAGEADEALEWGVRAIGATLDSAASFKQKFNGRDALISITILLAALSVLLASETWAWNGRRRRRRMTATGTAAFRHVDDSSSAGVIRRHEFLRTHARPSAVGTIQRTWSVRPAKQGASSTMAGG
jgi:uncharacterized membrane protein YgcG